jgi:hypothetical protein
MFGNILAGRRRAKLALLGALLAVAAVSLAATAPSAPQAVRHALLSCADTVTTDTVLSSDLNCPGSTGLIVGANGITIDLKGHTISGDGTHTGVLNIGHTGDTIKNGTISTFSIAILLTTAANSNTVKKVRANGNSQYGILATNSSSFVIAGDTALSNGTGIEEAGSSGQLSTNVANGNNLDGIRADDSAVTLTGNRTSFNGQFGIEAAPGSKDGGKNVVQDNGDQHQCANVVCVEVSS